MGVQLTPGQRCLLDLLQRKLTSTIESYAKLARKKQQQSQSADKDTNDVEIELELQRLKEKIRRISSRQKRFTLEIINGNGNNTIPKESFFEALGLITKETLVKLNSKTNERRRRTTANPRFSHEAIQAKKALEPLQRRTIESRVIRSGQDNNNRPNSNSSNNNNINNNNPSQRSGSSSAGGGGSAAPGNRRGGNRVNRNRNNLIQKEILAAMQREINTKVNQIQKKRESNKELERRNEMIRRRGLEIISAINLLKPDQNLAIRQKQQRQQQIQCQLQQQQQQQQLVIQKQQQQQQHQRNIANAKVVNKSGLVDNDFNTAAANNNSQQPNNNDNNDHQVNQVAQKPTKISAATTKTIPDPSDPSSINSSEPLDLWIDMKCEESLDGLD